MPTKEAITAASARYPKPADRTFQYGTAGVSRLQSDILVKFGLIETTIVSYEGVCSPNILAR